MRVPPSPAAGGDDLCALSALELGVAYRARRLSPVDVAEAVIRRIEAVNPLVNAFVTLTPGLALEEARRSEARFGRGEPRGPLDGVPVGIKDLTLTKGVRTTSGSRIFADRVPDEDAPVVERLRAGGALLLGKTNSPEFGWKSPTDNPLFGPTRNPWNLGRTPAGSSGGSAVAVATGMGPVATGGDGGGSIRQPASFCGVFGFKPTFGLVPMCPPSTVGSLVSEGPLTRTVRDGALMLAAMAGHDPRDPFSAPVPLPDLVSECDRGVRGLRVAWSPNLGYAAVDPDVRRITERAARRFEELGCAVEEADPGWPDPFRLFHVLFYALVGGSIDAHHLPQWSGKLDPGLERVVELGRNVSGFDIARATDARGELQTAAARFFERHDLLLTPTMALPPFPVGIDFPDTVGGLPVDGMQWTAFTFPFNLTGQPAASVPAGLTDDGLPIGLQIVGRRWEDARVLRASAAFEALAPWAGDWPPVVERRSANAPV